MNKQLTKKTIGIAASAALMATLAFSSSAYAGKGGNPPTSNKQGPQTSISVNSTCAIADLNTFIVDVLITDNNADNPEKPAAQLESVNIQSYKKFPPKTLKDDGMPAWNYDAVNYPDRTCEEDGIVIGTSCAIPLNVNVCAAIADGAKALNALTTVKTGAEGAQESYTTYCNDSDLKLESFKAACDAL